MPYQLFQILKISNSMEHALINWTPLSRMEQKKKKFPIYLVNVSEQLN